MYIHVYRILYAQYVHMHTVSCIYTCSLLWCVTFHLCTLPSDPTQAQLGLEFVIDKIFSLRAQLLASPVRK